MRAKIMNQRILETDIGTGQIGNKATVHSQPAMWLCDPEWFCQLLDEE